MLTRRDALVGAATAGAVLRTRTSFSKASQSATPVNFDVPENACDCHTHIHADPDSDPSGTRVLRLYADALGESRFETTTMPMAFKEFAPPAAPFRVSDPQPAQNYVILEVGAKWGGAVPHPSLARMMAFSLSGCTRVTASSGESHTFVAGDCLLLDDTAGKGHSTEVISDPARWVFICLPN
jgi:hypothetical protein